MACPSVSLKERLCQQKDEIETCLMLLYYFPVSSDIYLFAEKNTYRYNRYLKHRKRCECHPDRISPVWIGFDVVVGYWRPLIEVKRNDEQQKNRGNNRPRQTEENIWWGTQHKTTIE